MRVVLKFWAAMVAVVVGITVVVGGSFLALSPFLSTTAIGLLWCGFMALASIAVCSWWVYEDERRR